MWNTKDGSTNCHVEKKSNNKNLQAEKYLPFLCIFQTDYHNHNDYDNDNINDGNNINNFGNDNDIDNDNNNSNNYNNIIVFLFSSFSSTKLFLTLVLFSLGMHCILCPWMGKFSVSVKKKLPRRSATQNDGPRYHFTLAKMIQRFIKESFSRLFAVFGSGPAVIGASCCGVPACIK